MMERNPQIIKKAQQFLQDNKPTENVTMIVKSHPALSLCKTGLWKAVLEISPVEFFQKSEEDMLTELVVIIGKIVFKETPGDLFVLFHLLRAAVKIYEESSTACTVTDLGVFVSINPGISAVA